MYRCALSCLAWFFCGTVCLAGQSRVVENIVYGGRHERQRLDLYLPAGQFSGKFSCFVFIHGGGWRNGDKSMVRSLPVDDLNATGCAVASINYELASRTNLCWPRNLEDCKAAVHYLREHASEYDLDPQQFIVSGASAGGHLALMAAYTSNEKSSIPFCGVIAFFPVCDLTRYMRSFPSARWGDPIMPESFDVNPDLYREGSPVFRAAKDVPPTLVFHGNADQTVEWNLHSGALVDKVRQLGAEAQLVKLDGAGHSLKWGRHTQDVNTAILRFVQEKTKVGQK